MGKLAEEIRADSKGKCRAQQIYDSLCEEDQKDLREAWTNNAVSPSAIEVALKKVHGLTLGHNTIERHRQAVCVCTNGGYSG